MPGTADTITQVALIVRDIEETKRKYAEFLGVPVPDTIGSGDYAVTQTTYRGAPAPDTTCKMAFFNPGPHIQLELIQPAMDAPSTWKDFLDEHGEGIHHIAFGVKGMSKVVAACEAQGMPLIQAGKYGDASGEYAYVDAAASLKCVVELLESY